MVKKMAPRKVKVCPGCPARDLEPDVTPQFQFVADNKRDTKKVTIIDNFKKLKGKVTSLF